MTFSYLNCHRNGEPSDFIVQKKCLNFDDLWSKMHLFQTLFLDLQLWTLAISIPVEVGRSYITQKKVLYLAVWKKFWMRYHLFQKFFGKMVKIKETSFFSTRGMYLSCHSWRPNGRSYKINMDSGKSFVRNRAFLFPISDSSPHPDSKLSNSPPNSDEPATLRRSSQLAKTT